MKPASDAAKARSAAAVSPVRPRRQPLHGHHQRRVEPGEDPQRAVQGVGDVREMPGKPVPGTAANSSGRRRRRRTGPAR
ncbi:hypothetical protein O1M63_09110 [Streptomyces mirabilis]|nr:hypothetical protein [Streptomyces mirabilis]